MAQATQSKSLSFPSRNRCEESKSPYVRSHANNPTAWQLWDPETLASAKQTNRSLFVSIGYSACHWCHVMAHESFMDPSVASILNDNFIPIKIDREERPDVDRVYMDFLQATTGGGGWPSNVFVTPDLEPIFGGTYWPGPGSERERHGGGFKNILEKVAQTWTEQEAKCRESAGQITRQLKEFAQEGTLSGRKSSDGQEAEDDDEALESELSEEAYNHYVNRFDSKFGGFGSAPKFPTPSHSAFSLRLGEWDGIVKDVLGEEETRNAMDMASKTLENMAKGGIKDQVGNGFARYSVTRDWSVPHFEKMLYDNAQLSPLYLDAYLITKSPLFLDTVHDVATYLTTAPIHSSTGGFHASEDADSAPSADNPEHKEGAFYVWTASEFRTTIDDPTAASICAAYWNIRDNGNIDRRADVQGELVGQNTLCVTKTPADLATDFGKSEEEIVQIIAEARRKLLSHRDKTRPRPHLDDKLVVSWNGLAIGGLARTAATLSSIDPSASQTYLSAAEKAAAFIKRELYNHSTKTLTRVYREGPGTVPGFADDYAFSIDGSIELYEATFNAGYSQWAEELQQTQLRLFFDDAQGGFLSTETGATDVLVRSKDAMDNAEPSTNGVSAKNSFRSASSSNDEALETKARKTVRAFEVEIGQHPGLFTGLMGGVVCCRLGSRGIMVSGDGEEAKEAVQRLRGMVRPGSTSSRVGGGVDDAWIKQRNELVKDSGQREMVQVCEGGQCSLVKADEVEKVSKGRGEE